jgi:hypothetical protein
MLRITKIMREMLWRWPTFSEDVARYLSMPHASSGTPLESLPEEALIRHALGETLVASIHPHAGQNEAQSSLNAASAHLIQAMFRGDAELRAHLDEDWLEVIRDEDLRKLPIDSEVGASCLRLIVKADAFLADLPDMYALARHHNPPLDYLLRHQVYEQCRVFLYG